MNKKIGQDNKDKNEEDAREAGKKQGDKSKIQFLFFKEPFVFPLIQELGKKIKDRRKNEGNDTGYKEVIERITKKISDRRYRRKKILGKRNRLPEAVLKKGIIPGNGKDNNNRNQSKKFDMPSQEFFSKDLQSD